MKRILILSVFVVGIVFSSGYGCASGAGAFVDGFNRGYNHDYGPAQQEKSDCAYCRGMGVRDCISCNGNGYSRGYKCYSCTKGLVKCFYCKGSGKN